MKNGFVKVAAATPHIRVADCDYNLNECVAVAKSAAKDGVKILVFPELCLTAYTCGDLFLSKTLPDAALAALKSFIDKTRTLDILSFIGLPLVSRGKLYNAAAAVKSGKLLGIVPKANIPNYAEFNEVRYFAAAPEEMSELDFFGEKVPFGKKIIFTCESLPALRVAAEICEDIWSDNPPSTSLASRGATVIANLSASNEIVGKDTYRRQLVKSQSAKTVSAYIYANAGEGESTTDLVFAGHSLIAENGTLLAERMPFDYSGKKYIATEIDLELIEYERRKNNIRKIAESDGYLEVEFDTKIVDTSLTRFVDPMPFVPADPEEKRSRAETILSIQAHGLKARIERSYSKKCIIGISGGLDSTLALLVCVKAMDLLGRPREDIIGVTMPCFGTTKRTKSNAEKLCEELWVDSRCVNISESVKSHFADIGHDISSHNVVFENSQARERTQVLMDMANAENALVIGTGDLSELALGWATYNGDHMSMYGVNGAIPKTLVRHLVDHLATEYESMGKNTLAAVLRDILDTPVSPELLPANDKGEIDQKTEDIVGPYELHDFFLYHTIRFGETPDKIFRLALYAFGDKYDATTIIKWLETFTRRFFSQQFKRSCLPDGPKVGTVGLSPRGDFKMPSDASSAVWLKIIENIKKEL